jgi:lipopolysaccharide/colanic/teichoic acid biosynthesis glycosyltransferase
VSRWIASPVRRAIDIALAALILVSFSVPMLIVGVCVRLTSKGRAVFSQDRVGLSGRLFRIYKFRSMAQNHEENASSGLTKDGDSRVTPLGHYLRKFKFDELPQFYNILRGDMSLVGPRPKLSQYASLSDMSYRPGITGAATIAFRREEEILRTVDPDEMDKFYAERIRPLKASLDVCYMCKATPLSDLRLIVATFLHCVAPTCASSVVRIGANLVGAGASTQSISPEQTSATDGMRFTPTIDRMVFGPSDEPSE